MGKLVVIDKKLGTGGSLVSSGVLRDAMRELQGYGKVTVAGAAAGTKMNVTDLRKGDTIIHALIATDAGGAQVDDSANMTIQETHAQGTITITGNPVDGETMNVNGFAYTWKAVPTALGHIKITAGNNNQMATDCAAAITAVEARMLSYSVTGGVPGNQPNLPAVTAVPSTNTVLVSGVVDGAGNPITLTGTAVRLVAAGTGTASATLTAASVANADTFAITDQTGTVITFTIKDTPTAGVLTDVLRTVVSDTAMATNIKNAINAYEQSKGNLAAKATSVAAVVTIVPRDALAGNLIVFTEAVTNLAMDGGGVLGGTTSGTATGGVKSATNLTSKSVTITYFHKS